MLENQPAPLSVARRVLKPETLMAVGRQPYTRRGWSILDRWAFNTPARLQALEARGLGVLLAWLLRQQTLETSALLEHAELLDTGTAELEVMQMAGVEPELDPLADMLATFDPERHGGEVMADAPVGQERLLSQRDLSAPPPADMALWDAARPNGRELL